MKSQRCPNIYALSPTILLTLVAALFSGCAGPATPLGAPWATTSSDVRNGPLAFIASLFRMGTSEIRFDPPHQVLHGPSPIKVIIKDPGGVRSNYKFVIRHNGLDVTPSFLRQATVKVDPKGLSIEVPVVRLNADADHLIEVIYGGGLELGAYARYEPPTCRAFAKKQILRTDGFSPGAELLALIQRISERRGFSPAFTAALIAQESSFNPNTVSWAKAIGLTQVTSVAENEALNSNPHWPRYPGINEYPAMFVKALVVSGSANKNNEWRLNSEKSIQGGLEYAHQLADRWSTPENLTRIRSNFDDPESALTRLILASYNSGFTRVSAAFNRFGPAWLSAPELKEARKYVNRISSLCESFSDQGVKHDENET